MISDALLDQKQSYNNYLNSYHHSFSLHSYDVTMHLTDNLWQGYFHAWLLELLWI